MRRTILLLLVSGLTLAHASVASAFHLMRYNSNPILAQPAKPHWWPVHDTLGQEWHNFSHWDLREFPNCQIPWSAGRGTNDLDGEFVKVESAFDSWAQVDPSPIDFLNPPVPKYQRWSGCINSSV